ncbi:vanin-like protein 1 [Leptinotarsa decemlineata]|uniref:vanin-like protein 1 n=1 Tax=Leptinotarsa decemlineata TaxID=7539 RepID=UPI003D304FFE
MKTLCIFSLLVVLISYIEADYVAAVVEYQVSRSSTPNLTVQSNIDDYISHIESASIHSAQIIVFPEYGLTGFVDDPTDYAIEIPPTASGPSFKDHWLTDLSNAARGHGMYVVVNLLEKQRNEKNKTIFYNTNVVFDKEGKIVAKYRKINLNGEPKLTPGKASENQVTFSTDFGITFGLFTGFDMFFYIPSRSILNGTFVTDIICPSYWFSALPFHHSLQFHSAYAQANKVNLLVSNVDNIREGVGGSGVYGGNGIVFSYYISGTPSSKLSIGRVSNTVTDIAVQGFDILDENDTQSSMENYKAGRNFDSNSYKFKDLNLSNGNITDRICDGTFCCSFNIIVSSGNSSDIYKLMAYAGPQKLGDRKDIYVRMCSLLACQTKDPSSCGTRNFNIATQFSQISVKTDVADKTTTFYQPISLRQNLLTVFNTTYNSSVANGKRFISFSTNKLEKNVIAFGIYGNGSGTLGISLSLLVIMLMGKYLF